MAKGDGIVERGERGFHRGGRTEMEPRSHALLILSFMACSQERVAAVVIAGERRAAEQEQGNGMLRI